MLVRSIPEQPKRFRYLLAVSVVARFDLELTAKSAEFDLRATYCLSAHDVLSHEFICWSKDAVSFTYAKNGLHMMGKPESSVRNRLPQRSGEGIKHTNC